MLRNRVRAKIGPLSRNRDILAFSAAVYGATAVLGLGLTFVSTPVDPGIDPGTSGVHLPLDDQSLFVNILVNNVIVWGILVLGGIVLAIPTILNITFNGLLFGITLSLGSEVGPATLALFILPHGIVEIPALLIACAAGLKIPHELIRYARGTKEHILYVRDVRDALYLAGLSVVGILVAAWIESTITIWMVETFTEYTVAK